MYFTIRHIYKDAYGFRAHNILRFAMERKYIKVQTFVTESVPFTFIIAIIILKTIRL